MLFQKRKQRHRQVMWLLKVSLSWEQLCKVIHHWSSHLPWPFMVEAGLTLPLVLVASHPILNFPKQDALESLIPGTSKLQCEEPWAHFQAADSQALKTAMSIFPEGLLTVLWPSSWGLSPGNLPPNWLLNSTTFAASFWQYPAWFFCYSPCPHPSLRWSKVHTRDNTCHLDPLAASHLVSFKHMKSWSCSDGE